MFYRLIRNEVLNCSVDLALMFSFLLPSLSRSQINLRLILVSGKTKEFLFSPSESAGEIAKIVFEQWPEGEWNCDNDRDNDYIV